MTTQIGVGNKGEEHIIDEQFENHQNYNWPEPPDEPDESWWGALLADEPIREELFESIENFKVNGVDPGEVDKINSDVNWDRIRYLFEKDEIVSLMVVGFNRGGLLVAKERIRGFVPTSHLIDVPIHVTDDEREQYLISYLDREISLKVIECEPEKERIIFSERAALAGAGQRKELLHNLSEGNIVDGTVTNITSFGAFVDLGGLEGLIHISELSWGRVSHPSKILQVGQQVQSMVIQISEEQGRIGLSTKRLKKNPWIKLSKVLSPGDVVDAVISNIVKYGAFARLDEGVEGLIHVSSISFPDDCNTIDEFLYVGQPVKVSVISIDPQKRRLGLLLESI